MYNFTDLIAMSYLKYVNKGKNEVNIAQIFFQEHHLVRPDAKEKYIFSHKQFYTELINEINTLIRGAAHNRHINSPDFDFDYAKAFEEFQQKRLLDHQSLMDHALITHVVKRVDYEQCTNAKQLIEALDHGLNLIDPVRIISPNKEIQAEDLVLRKSKLDYLKSEAIRARDAEIINDLDNLPPNEGSPSNTFISENEIKVKKAFEFTLKEGKLKKQILSNEDHLRLLKWVTFYFDNEYKLPNVDTPISELNIGVTYIRYAFKLLIDQIHTPYARPESFYTLVPLCFKDLETDTKKDIQATSKPARWEKFNP